MNPLFIFVIWYTVAVRTPIPCGDNVHCSGVSCSWSCYESTGQTHAVEFTDEQKALKFITNLKPYNHVNTLSKNVPDNKRFIYGLTARTYVRDDNGYLLVNEHEVE